MGYIICICTFTILCQYAIYYYCH